MANEFIIKNGLILNESESITGITNSTALTYNSNALVSEFSIKSELNKYVNKTIFNTHTGLTGSTNPHIIAFDDLSLTAHTHISQDILLSTLTNNTETLYDSYNSTNSSGIISGGDLTYNNDLTVDVSSMYGLIRENNSFTSELKYFNTDDITGLTIISGVTNYIMIEYNAGLPNVFISTTDISNNRNTFCVGKIYVYNDLYFITKSNIINSEVLKNTSERFREDNLIRTSGLNMINVTALTFEIESGNLYLGLRKIPINAKLSGETFNYAYRDGVDFWSFITGQTFIDPNNWDDGTGTLHSTVPGYYVNHYIYVDINGRFFVNYGQKEFKYLNNANSEPIIKRQDNINDFSVFIGRITTKQGTDIMHYDSAFAEIFTTDDVDIEHNSLSNLQGGASDEMYHFNHTNYTIYTTNQDATGLHHHNLTYYTKSQSDAKYNTILTFNSHTGLTGSTNPHAIAFDDLLSTAHTHYVSDINSFTEEVVKSYGSITQEPTGFINSTDSILSFDNNTRIFSISPTGTSYTYYIQGIKYENTGTTSIQINNINGLHRIAFDITGKLIVYDPADFDLSLFYTKTFIAEIYWNTIQQKIIHFGSERHGMKMDGETHAYLHLTIGAAYQNGLELSNFNIDGTGNLNNNIQFSINDGTIRDEDITHNILNNNPQKLSPILYAPVLYLSGTTNVWYRGEPTQYSVISGGTGRLMYNDLTGGIWTQQEVTNNAYVLYHIFATNDIEYPIYSIMGQKQYLTLISAKQGAFDEIKTLTVENLPTVEFVKLGTIIYQTSDSYTNDLKARIISIDNENYVNWINTTGIATHNSLSNLDSDDHLQYALLNGRENDILNIDNIVEYSTNSGVTLENVILKDNTVSALTYYGLDMNIYNNLIVTGNTNVLGTISASTVYGVLPFTSSPVITTDTNIRESLNHQIKHITEIFGTGVNDTINFIVKISSNTFRILEGSGYINNGIIHNHINWSQQDFITTGYTEGTYYIYVDINSVINISLTEPNYYLNVVLGGFYYDKNQIISVSNEGRIITDLSTNIFNYMKHLGIFIYDNAGLLYNITGTTQIYSTACKIQQLTKTIQLNQITIADLGVKLFSYYNSLDNGWDVDYSFFNNGLIQTDRWNNINGMSNVTLSGTCSFTNNSNIINTSVDLTTQISEKSLFWKINEVSNIYVVSSITSTQITLTSNYSGVTETTTGLTNNALIPITSGYFIKHLIIRTVDDRMIIINSQDEFATFDDALNGALPKVPDSINLNSFKIAYIIVQQGDIDLDDKIYDIRPLPFQDKEGGQLGSSSGGGGVIDHGLLLGLNDDDHLQYLLTNGNRDITSIIKYSTNMTFINDTSLIDKKYVDDANNLNVKYTDSVTNLNDVTSAGSGAIITTSERNNLHTHSNKSILDNLSASTGILTYNNIPMVTGISQLNDVTITNPIVDEILRFNGTQWINSDPVYTENEVDTLLSNYSLSSHTHDKIILNNTWVDILNSDNIQLVSNNILVSNFYNTAITMNINDTSLLNMSDNYFKINAGNSNIILTNTNITLSAETNNSLLNSQPDGNVDLSISTTKYVDDAVSSITSAILQTVRTTNGTLTNASTWYDISFDLKDIENEPSIISLSADTINFEIHENGLYLVSYDLQVTNSTSSYFNSRVFKNNTTEISASISYIDIYSNESHMIVQSFIVNLISGDTIKLQLQCENNNATIIANSTFTAVKQDSIKGKQGIIGPIGLTGADGDITWQGEWVNQNYVINQAVSYNGSSYVCHTNTTSNQIPTDTNYWDIFALKGDPGVGSSIIISKDNITVGTTTEKINFTGNVNATDAGSLITDININYLDIKSNGTSINSSTTILNYTGNGIESITSSLGTTTINIEKFYLGELQVEDTVGGQDINNGIAVILNFDYSFIFDTTYFTKISDSRIRILNTGIYEVSFNVFGDSAHNGRSTPITSIYVNGTEILKTRTSAYSRNTTDSKTSNTLSPVYLSLNVNDYIEVQSIQGGSSGTVNTVANCNWLKIKYKA